MKLAGRSVVVCRATHQAGPLLDALAEVGATAVHVPLIEVVAPSDGGAALRDAIERADIDTWWCFTSSNAVDAVAGVTRATNETDAAPTGRTAVVGGATADRVAAHGWPVDVVGAEPTARGLGQSLAVEAHQRVIAPLAELASDDLADAFHARGLAAEVVIAYRTITPDVGPVDLQRVLDSDAVLVTSPSVIRRLVGFIGERALPALIAIGPTSAAAIEAEGLEVAGQADEPSVTSLIDAVVRTLQP